MSIKDHVRGTSSYQYFRGGYFYYKTDDTGFEFMIPYEDTEGATFLNTDKSIFFMRWIRRQINEQQAENTPKSPVSDFYSDYDEYRKLGL